MTDVVPVRVIGAGGSEYTWQLSYEQFSAGCRITLAAAGDNQSWSALGQDLFEAFCALRVQLEALGVRICVNGARVDAYPSGMSRDMGGGQMLHVLRQRNRLERLLRMSAHKTSGLVDIFGPALCEIIGSVEEQRTFYDSWLRDVT
jgi:hypothetical protein